MRIEPVFLFDLDGTLVDSVYQHVLAWKAGARRGGHRALGLAHPSQDRHERRPVHQPAAARDRRRRSAPTGIERLRRAACRGLSAGWRRRSGRCRARANCWPGSTEAGIPWAIATSGRMETAAVNLAALGVDPAADPGRDARPGQIRQARSRPVPGRGRAAERADRDAPSWSATASGTCWRPRAAARSASGSCRGGYGADELQQAGAFRVYEDPGRPARPYRRGRRPALASHSDHEARGRRLRG